ncbi:MAG TPA: DUF5615 family PIN-like protein [Planctomycetota bacterium]|jgi:predicted nuclease of predicted toxin-antitoxin system|nr:DUF5615 family PIN-like protein [Planctomycetota bacterium]
MPPPPFARLVLDEDVHARLAGALRARGHDVVALAEVGRLGSRDEENLRWATREGRAIATFNAADFVALHESFQSLGVPHSGILLSPQVPLSELRLRLLAALRRWSGKDLRNGLFWMRGSV